MFDPRVGHCGFSLKNTLNSHTSLTQSGIHKNTDELSEKSDKIRVAWREEKGAVYDDGLKSKNYAIKRCKKSCVFFPVRKVFCFLPSWWKVGFNINRIQARIVKPQKLALACLIPPPPPHLFYFSTSNQRCKRHFHLTYEQRARSDLFLINFCRKDRWQFSASL